jgi:hypothetical protein
MEWNEQRIATTGQGIMAVLAWYEVDSERGLCLARLQCFISSGHYQGLVHCHVYLGYWKWWSRWPVYRTIKRASCLLSHLFVIFHTFCKVFASTLTHIPFFRCPNILPRTTLPILILP